MKATKREVYGLVSREVLETLGEIETILDKIWARYLDDVTLDDLDTIRFERIETLYKEGKKILREAQNKIGRLGE